MEFTLDYLSNDYVNDMKWDCLLRYSTWVSNTGDSNILFINRRNNEAKKHFMPLGVWGAGGVMVKSNM